MKIIGPFHQILTLAGLPLRGKISDSELQILSNAAIAVDGRGIIAAIDDFENLQKQFPEAAVEKINVHAVALPAFIDSHTHICYGGTRAKDFAMRNAGKTYLEIAESGGGIWSSVQHTREASERELLKKLLERIQYLISLGVTTIEVKSGYGLDVDNELKMLRVIKKAQGLTEATLIPTCLAAHLKPKDFEGSSQEYLDFVLSEILPAVKAEELANRVDIFIEKSAFAAEESKTFLEKAKMLGFEITVHADQFTPGSSHIAVEVGAVSADHLEATADADIRVLANSDTVATVLPGASLGLGEPFAPARKLLDAGAIVNIASDWNPGSAPMGNLVTQASILATYQKLSSAEVFAALTFRAARALNLSDRGQLEIGKKADLVVYETNDFQEILYQQGRLNPSQVYINGNVQINK